MYRYLLKRTIALQIMKTLLTYTFLVILLIGCKNEHHLTLAPKKILGEECSSCPKVSIVIPEVLENSKVADNINNSILEEVVSLLIFEETEGVETSTITRAIESFKDGYTEMTRLYDDEDESWEANIMGKVTYEDKNTLTISLDSYLFTGGAHGYSSKRFLNFNKNNGAELENWQLFTNSNDFRKFAEAKFRLQEKIPEDKPINHTGFMFEKDSFYLPENIGFTQKGVQLLYNQYEVASYADGPIELVLPYSEVMKYLRTKIKYEGLISSTSFEETE
ncbi:MAG: DUF3298 domain-containing protein [Aurantibacter sp.]